MKFNPKKIEAKWAKIWDQNKTFKVDLKNAKKPFYNLAMFPYPSGEGLHMGHIIPYSGVDTYGRFLRMNGYDVFEPMGFDAFGIHSENFAIKKGIHPKTLISRTTRYFREKQMKRLGTLFDWDHEVNTTDPNYYKWTQWLFIQMFKAGLAEKKKAPVTYCPSCKTVLSDEQTEILKIDDRKSKIDLEDRGLKIEKNNQSFSFHLPPPSSTIHHPSSVSITVCERCKTPIERRETEQWFFKITKYADKLLANLDHINWSEKTKRAQRNWIGKSEGINIEYEVVDGAGNKCTMNNVQCTITCFTTTPVNFGATFLVLAPEHKFVSLILSPNSPNPPNSPTNLRSEIQAYVSSSKSKSEQDRIAEGRDKTGVFTGFYAINHVTKKRIPIWISDFVIASVGTGAVQGCPGHDKRDFLFAKKFGIPIPRVVTGPNGETGPIEKEEDVVEHFNGLMINSDFLNGIEFNKAMEMTKDYFEKQGWGKRVTTYKLRDWCISRQRYWGPPIPMVYCRYCAERNDGFFTKNENKSRVSKYQSSNVSKQKYLNTLIPKYLDTSNSMPGWFPVPETDLPVLLPFVRDYKPAGDGKSPLAKNKKWMKVKCPNCGGWAERETDVSDTFLDSAWYFLRYPSVGIENLKLKIENFPWDREVTGKWLPVDLYIGGNEHAVLHLMYSRFITMALKDMGYIDFEEPFKRFFAHGLLISEGAKMSKSRGNVINPNSYLDKYGADTLRMYILFLGPYDAGGDFRDAGISGMFRFLNRIWTLVLSSPNLPNHPNHPNNPNLIIVMHKTIKKVTEDIKSLHFNTAIASLMEFYNLLIKVGSFSGRPKALIKTRPSQEWQEALKTLLLLLAPLAPFISEELWQNVAVTGSVHDQPWPKYDEKLLVEKKVTVVIQINGKIRDKIELDSNIARNQAEVEKLALECEKIKTNLSGKKVIKSIFIPEKLINFVIGL